MQYGEKLILLAEASKPLLEAFPSVPPTAQHPYTGNIYLLHQGAAPEGPRHLQIRYNDSSYPTSTDNESRSFGETHASELSRIASVADHRPPPVRKDSPSRPVPTLATLYEPGSAGANGRVDSPPVASAASGISYTSVGSASTPVNPNPHNNAPAPIPSHNSSSALNLSHLQASLNLFLQVRVQGLCPLLHDCTNCC